MNFEGPGNGFERDPGLLNELIARVKNELDGDPNLSIVSALNKVLNQKYPKGPSELSHEAFSAYLHAIEEALNSSAETESFQSRAYDPELLRDMEEAERERGGDPED